MPSTTNTGKKPAKKPQTHRRAPARPVADDPIDPVPVAAVVTTPPPPAPPAQPVASAESLFDDDAPAPPAAEPSTDETARPGEASADDRPEGVVDEEAETPPAPEQAAPVEAVEDPAPAQEPVETGEAEQGGEGAQEEQPAHPAVDAEGETTGEGDPAALLEELKRRRETLQEPEDSKADELKQQPEADKPSPGEPVTVRLGQASGLLHRMSLGSVLAFADAFADKIEALQYAAPVQALLSRVRATEGRCAPIYFTMSDDGEPDHLFAGDDALAAAKAAGIETVSVVLFHPGDADAIQAFLNQQASMAAVSTEDDELVWRAHHDSQPASPA